MLKKSLVPLLALLAVAAGCSATDRGAVAMTDLCFPPTPTNGACALPKDCDPRLANGELEVDLVTSGGTLEYPVNFINLRNDNNDGQLRTSTNEALVEQLELRYQATGLTISDARVNQHVDIPANGSTVGELELIPAEVGAALVGAIPTSGVTRMVIQVRAHGAYLDGTSFETAWFPVPVKVSNSGGLVPACPAGKTLSGVCPQPGQTSVVACQ